MLCLLFLSQSFHQMKELDKIYTPSNVDQLERFLQEMKGSPKPSHIRPLVAALQRHAELMDQTHVSLDNDTNLAAGVELYGDAYHLLDEAIRLHFQKFGNEVRKTPIPLLTVA